MANCLNCNAETDNPKFCSKSCAASFNGKLYPKRTPIARICKRCNSSFHISSDTWRKIICPDCYEKEPNWGAKQRSKKSRIRFKKEIESVIKKEIPPFDITHIVKKGDYIYVKDRTHPNATSNGYILLHRVIIENNLGRLLTSSEIVHHKDENKLNNDLSNLEVMSVTDHAKLHHPEGRTFVECICPNCLVTFNKEKRCMKEGVIPKCSRKCNGEYSRKIQLGRL